MENVRYAARPAYRRRNYEPSASPSHPFVVKFFKQVAVSAIIWCVLAGLASSQTSWAQYTVAVVRDSLHANIEYSTILQRAGEIWHALQS